MEILNKAGRYFYGIGITGIGIQHWAYRDFRPVILPEWPLWMHRFPIEATGAGAALIFAAIMICLSKKPREAALITGGAMLLFFLAFHLPYMVFVSPNTAIPGAWSNPLKLLAFSGGAFAIAGSLPVKEQAAHKISALYRFLELFIPWGRVFFSITMIVFGIDHFIYTEFVASLVPAWIPGHNFWTYFAAVALVGSGVCIILKIKLRLIAMLLGIMIFLWLILLHIPRAVVALPPDNGNELTSVFEALAFSGVAFVIAWSAGNKVKKTGLESV